MSIVQKFIESTNVEVSTSVLPCVQTPVMGSASTKHIVCMSGGDSSAKVALNVAYRFGKENVILLNHDINSEKENDGIKRFKQQIADYIGIPITYANYNDIQNPNEIPNQFDVCINAGALTSPNGNALCTAILKTEPFYKWLQINFPRGNTLFETEKDCVIYYGFDKKEIVRMQRRSSLLGAMGYKTDYTSLWDEKHLPYKRVKQIKIKRPKSYKIFKHANCIGCLKASILHWYVTYCKDKVAYAEAIVMENELDYTIHELTFNKLKRAISLTELAPIFEIMKNDRVPQTEHQSAHKFANLLKKYKIEEDKINKPCECFE